MPRGTLLPILDRMTNRILGACALLAVTAASPLAAQNLRTDRFHWENDVGTTDRHYTNGLRYSTVSSSTELWQERIEHPLLQVLLLGARACREDSLPNEPCHVLRTGWAMGQNFYTPEVITDPTPDPADRPYAGWLYHGWIFELSRAPFVHEVELDVGLVGPLSLASSIQEGWHNLFGWDHPAGWDHQIARGLGVQAVYRSTYDLLSRRLDGQEIDADQPAHLSLTPTGQVSLGTPITAANLGGMLRFGRGVPPAVVSRIGPVLMAPAAMAAAVPPAGAARTEALPERVRLRRDAYVARKMADRPRHAPVRPLYAFAGASVHGVLLNDFLQGTHLGARSDNPQIGVEMNHAFAEWEAGATVALPFVPLIGAADITVRRVHRGAEYRGGPDHHFWALSIGW